MTGNFQFSLVVTVHATYLLSVNHTTVMTDECFTFFVFMSLVPEHHFALVAKILHWFSSVSNFAALQMVICATLNDHVSYVLCKMLAFLRINLFNFCCAVFNFIPLTLNT